MQFIVIHLRVNGSVGFRYYLMLRPEVSHGFAVDSSSAGNKLIPLTGRVEITRPVEDHGYAIICLLALQVCIIGWIFQYPI